MKLYDFPHAPNPRRVRVFLAEKGIEVRRVTVDIMRGEQRTPQFTALNPRQAVPVLELDDGTVITESIAICRYFEETQPRPPLFGTSTLARAQTEMWQRRIEFGLMAAIGNFFQHSHPLMASVQVPQIAAWAKTSQARARGGPGAGAEIFAHARAAACGQAVRLRRHFHGRRHHRARLARFHEIRRDRASRRRPARAPVARGARRTAERGRVMCLLTEEWQVVPAKAGTHDHG